jgi:hypothetical protein
MYIIVSSLGAISKETIKDIDIFIRHEDKLVRGKGISKEAKLWSKRFVMAAVKGSFRIWINAPHGIIIKDKANLKKLKEQNILNNLHREYQKRDIRNHDLHQTTLEDGQCKFSIADGHEVNIDLDETETKVDSNLNLDEENWCIDKEYDLENREEAVMEFGGKPLFDPNFIQGIENANNYFEVNQLIVNARKELEDQTLNKSDSDPDNHVMEPVYEGSDDRNHRVEQTNIQPDSALNTNGHSVEEPDEEEAEEDILSRHDMSDNQLNSAQSPNNLVVEESEEEESEGEIDLFEIFENDYSEPDSDPSNNLVTEEPDHQVSGDSDDS